MPHEKTVIFLAQMPIHLILKLQFNKQHLCKFIPVLFCLDCCFYLSLGGWAGVNSNVI